MIGSVPDRQAVMDLAIATHVVHFRHVDDIGSDDIDAVIFGEPERGTVH